MRPTRTPAFELRVALRAPGGQVRARTRLCWADTPSSAAVLDALLRRVSEARRRGLKLVVEEAPGDFGPLLLLAGFGAPDCPLGLGNALPGAALPGAALPGNALPGNALPGAALPGGALPGAALPETDDGSVGEL